MKNVKEFLKKVRELWKIPKYRGVIQLLFWIIFFTFVILLIRSGNKVSQNVQEKKEETNIEEKNNIDSYIYNYQIIDEVSTINIGGTYYQGKEVFNFNNNRYYLKDNQYYLVLDSLVETTFDYAMNEFNYNNINSLVSNLEYESKTEFKDQTEKYEYIIDSVTYNNFYGKTNDEVGPVNISITKKDDLIASVTINYSNYLVNKNNFQVIISYSNVNNINGLDINIE